MVKKQKQITYESVFEKEKRKQQIKEFRRKAQQELRTPQQQKAEKSLRFKKGRETVVRGVGLSGFVSKITARPQAVKGERRAVARRAAGVGRLMGAMGVTGQSRGRGRPSGTYKYGLPIQEFKKQQSRQRALYQLYQNQQMGQLAQRGLTPEMVRQIQMQRSIEEGRLPQQQVGQVQQGQFQPQQMPQSFQETPESVMHVADDELAFRRFAAEKTISPNTQRMLVRLRRVQLKAQRDDVENQRRLKERRMISRAGNLLDTPFVFNKAKIDFTKMEGEGNLEILKAPNIFTEDKARNPNIMTTNRFNILQTREGGNDLF